MGPRNGFLFFLRYIKVLCQLYALWYMLAKAGYPGSSVHIPAKLPPPIGAPIPICSHKSHQWPAWTGAVWQGATFRVVSQWWSFVEGEVYPSAIQISSEHGVYPIFPVQLFQVKSKKKKAFFFGNCEPNPTQPFCMKFIVSYSEGVFLLDSSCFPPDFPRLQ